VVVNLTWGGPVRKGAIESAPRKQESTPQFAPPESNKKLPSGSRYQKLTGPERPGVKNGEGKGPSIRNIQLEDLLSFSRTEELYRQAVGIGLIKHSENQALNWLGAAVRAKSVAGDPVRVFAGIVRKGLWQNITQEQEERARTALCRYREVNPGFFFLEGRAGQ
jgi:hypothetical protein